jgi:hypothetical protein
LAGIGCGACVAAWSVAATSAADAPVVVVAVAVPELATAPGFEGASTDPLAGLDVRPEAAIDSAPSATAASVTSSGVPAGAADPGEAAGVTVS